MDFTTCFGHAIKNLIARKHHIFKSFNATSKRIWPHCVRAQLAGWMGIGRKNRGEKKVFHAIEGTVCGLKVD